MSRNHKDLYTVRIGTEGVSVKARGESTLRVGTILGSRAEADGTTTLWVDRLLHDGHPCTLRNGIHLGGAISTVLTVPIQAVLADPSPDASTHEA